MAAPRAAHLDGQQAAPPGSNQKVGYGPKVQRRSTVGANYVTPIKICATENNKKLTCTVQSASFVPRLFSMLFPRLFLTSRHSFGMVVFAKSTTKPKGDQIMNRKREAIFMGIGILAGLALSGPAAQAAIKSR